MKQQYKLAKRCAGEIEDVRAMISYTSRNPSYAILHSEEDREKDLDTCHKVLKDLLKEQYTHLENLQMEIEKEKHRVSQAQKQLTLRSHV